MRSTEYIFTKWSRENFKETTGKNEFIFPIIFRTSNASDHIILSTLEGNIKGISHKEVHIGSDISLILAALLSYRASRVENFMNLFSSILWITVKKPIRFIQAPQVDSIRKVRKIEDEISNC